MGCGSATSRRCRRARSRRATPATSPFRWRPAAPGATGRTRRVVRTWWRIIRSTTSTSHGDQGDFVGWAKRSVPTIPFRVGTAHRSRACPRSAHLNAQVGQARPACAPLPTLQTTANTTREGMTTMLTTSLASPNRVKLTIATTDYDHFRDFRTGVVQAEGIEHTWLTLGHHEIFSRFTFNREWDVTELS